MIIIQTDKQTIFDFPSQITTAVTSTYQLYYKPPLTFLHFPLKSFQTFYSLVRLVLNWPRQPNSAAIRILRFVNPFNLRKKVHTILFCDFLIISKFSLLIWEVIGTPWPFCMNKPFRGKFLTVLCMARTLTKIGQILAIRPLPMLIIAKFGHWHVYVCMWPNLENVWLQLL